MGKILENAPRIMNNGERMHYAQQRPRVLTVAEHAEAFQRHCSHAEALVLRSYRRDALQEIVLEICKARINGKRCLCIRNLHMYVCTRTPTILQRHAQTFVYLFACTPKNMRILAFVHVCTHSHAKSCLRAKVHVRHTCQCIRTYISARASHIYTCITHIYVHIDVYIDKS